MRRGGSGGLSVRGVYCQCQTVRVMCIVEAISCFSQLQSTLMFFIAP